VGASRPEPGAPTGAARTSGAPRAGAPTGPAPDATPEYRVLVLAPTGRNAVVIAEALGHAGVTTAVCPDMETLCAALREGAGCAVLVEEALSGPAPALLAAVLGEQPAWSDVPLVVLLAAGRPGVGPGRRLLAEAAGNVTLVQRPLRKITLLSTVRTALRARRRQYQVRADLVRHSRAEQTLRETQRNLERTQALSLVMPLHVGLDGCWLRLPPTFVAFLGYEREGELLGRHFREVTHPDDFLADWSQVERLVRGEIQSFELEKRFLRRDGTVTWGYLNCSLVEDDQGRPLHLLTYVRDVNQQKAAERALRESRERLKLAQQVGRIGTFEWDLRTDTLAWTPEMEALYGLAEGTFGGTPEHWRALVHPDDRPAAERALAVALESGQFQGEWRAVGPDGTVRWLAARGGLLRDEAGRPERLIGSNVDITDRKRAELALREARDELEQRVAERTAELAQRAEQLARLSSELTLTEQRERQRLATVLHDHLQQLLVGASMGMDLLVRRVGSEVRPTARKVRELLGESIKASRALTAELSPPILREGGLSAGLEWLGRWMGDRHGLDVDVRIGADVPATREDVEVLLYQSVRELLFNVVKHAGVRRARVELVRHDDQRVRVRVSDEGTGFGSGQTAVEPTERALVGGFGLFSIRERLHLLGGQMDIRTGAGRGTQVTLVAPALAAGEPKAARAASRSAPQPVAELAARARPREGGRTGVLLVDDHTVMREGLAQLVDGEADLEVVGQAASGEQAIELARALRPDVILMDSSMPGMDGVAATRIIHAELPEVRIIGLSMFEEADRADAMCAAGAVRYLTKSGSSDVLLATIREQDRAKRL
jgi:PAS domain S-box-containing protein